MRFHLTQNHINRGLRFTSTMCPIALCIREKISIMGFLQVCSRHIAISSDKGYFRITTPYEVGKWILDYDLKKEVEPFSFELFSPELGWYREELTAA